MAKGKGEKIKQKRKSPVIFAGGLTALLLAATAVSCTFTPLPSMVLPLSVAGVAFALSVGNLIMEIRAYRAAEDPGPGGGTFAKWLSDNKKVIRMWLWMLGFVVLIYFIGMLWAGAVFIFCFLLFQAHAKWHVALITSACVALAVYFVFERLFQFMLYGGLLATVL